MALSEKEELELLSLEREKSASAKPPQPSMLDRMSGGIQGVMNKMTPFMSAAQKMQNVVTPGSGVPEMALGVGQEVLNRLGGATAEYAGKKGMNPYAGAALGMGVANLPMLMNPEGEGLGAGRFLKPSVPEARLPGVQAAREFNIPLTRAEQTGSRMGMGLENLIEKTPMGSRPIQKFREGQLNALEQAKGGLQEKMGTQADLFSVGQKAQSGLKNRAETLRTKKDAMFQAVPENVSIPLSESRNVADQIIHEQSQYLPATRNGDVTGLAKDIQDAEKAVSQGVPNYPTLKRLREVLNARIEANNKGVQSGLPGQANSVARDYLRLKSAVDKDIDNYVANQKTPLGSMMGKEFAQSYRKANAFSGAYSKLFKDEQGLALAETPPEKIVDNVFKTNNETGIKRFRAMVGDEGFQPAKQKFTQDLLDSKNIKSELSKYKPGTLSAIYSMPELNRIKKFAEAQDILKSVTSLQGTQGSARSNVSAAQYGGLFAGAGELMRGDIPGAVAGATQFAAPYPIAKAITSEAAQKGIPVSAGQNTVNMLIRALLKRKYADSSTFQ